MEASRKIELLLSHFNVSPKVFSEMLGYERPQIIYDIQRGKTRRISEDLARRITDVFTNISKAWLLADDGSMFKETVTQTNSGDNSMQIVGSDNTLNCAEVLSKAIDEIGAQRQLVERSLEQIERLTALLEGMRKEK